MNHQQKRFWQVDAYYNKVVIIANLEFHCKIMLSVLYLGYHPNNVLYIFLKAIQHHNLYLKFEWIRFNLFCFLPIYTRIDTSISHLKSFCFYVISRAEKEIFISCLWYWGRAGKLCSSLVRNVVKRHILLRKVFKRQLWFA